MSDKLATAKAALRGHENCAVDCDGRLGLLELERHERIERTAAALVEFFDPDQSQNWHLDELIDALTAAVHGEAQ